VRKRKEIRNRIMRIIVTQILLANGKSRRLRGAELVSNGETERETDRDGQRILTQARKLECRILHGR
jgi:hypothetical protein